MQWRVCRALARERISGLVGLMLEWFVGCIWSMGVALHLRGIERDGRIFWSSDCSRQTISVVMSRYVKVKITEPLAQIHLSGSDTQLAVL